MRWTVPLYTVGPVPEADLLVYLATCISRVESPQLPFNRLVP